MRTIRTIGLGAMAAAALALGACGGDDGAAAGTTAEDPDAARLAWAECMREHGIDIPDPEPGGGPARVQLNGSPEEMETAQAACEDLRAAAMPEMTEEQQAEALDRFVEFAECMREHGVDMPDPEAGPNGGVIMRAGPGQGMLDPESPAFQEAQEACEHLQPTPPGS